MATTTTGVTTPAATFAAINAANKTSSTGAATSASSVNATQDRFLKMLVTQMKNQDPMNPMDNAQVTSQMAQLSTVTGIDKLNATLNALSANMTASQAFQSTNLIGRNVLVPGSSMTLANGQGLGGVDLTTAADNLTVTIKDSAGMVVRTLDLGAQAAGTIPVAWDGMTNTGAAAPAGSYTISASQTLGGQQSAANTLAYGMVNGITPGAQGATLNVAGLGNVAQSSIKQVF